MPPSQIDTTRRGGITARRIGLGILLAIAAFAAYTYFSLPSAAIRRLREENPELTAMMRQRIEESGGSLEIRRQWVPLEKISRNFVRAVLAAEDRRFFLHPGIDWTAIERAYARNQRSGRVRLGGSTITMQLAKNLFLSSERSFFRKGKEAIIALRLEKELPKRRILELYLNVIELGEGIFGVEAASQHYFHKPASALTRDEAARLAAIIPSPRRHSPLDNSGFVNRRAGILRKKLGG